MNFFFRESLNTVKWRLRKSLKVRVPPLAQAIERPKYRLANEVRSVEMEIVRRVVNLVHDD